MLNKMAHTENMIKGERDPGSSGKKDPEYSSNPLTNEELKVRQKENIIRKEQVVPAGKLPE